MSAFKTWLTGLTSKSTPVDADELYLRDSVGSASNKLTWANVKATLKTYTDTLYLALTGGTLAGGTRTTSGSTLTITETLNNAAVAFPGALIIDQTHTASAAGSLIADFKAGSVSKNGIRKDGSIILSAAGGMVLDTTAISGGLLFQQGGYRLFVGPSGANVGQKLQFASYAGDSSDATICRVGSLGLKVADGDGTNLGDLTLRNVVGTGNLATGIAAKTANYTATTNDHTIAVDASGGAVTITGFACSGKAGNRLTIKKTDSSGNAVTFDPNASETVDGASTKATSTQYGGFTVQINADGTAWFVVATF